MSVPTRPDLLALPADARLIADDTCVQPGYWEFVSDFIRDSVLHRKETKSIPERKDTFGPGATKGTEEELKQEGAETLSRL